MGVASVTKRSVPRCQFHQTLVGGGSFMSGLWEYYSCGPSIGNLADHPEWTCIKGGIMPNQFSCYRADLDD